jgi:glycosyltransferase involved in cell wall biosynthesis
VTGEKKNGIDAGILDVTPATDGAYINGVMEGYPKVKDETIEVKSKEWADNADAYIRHSYIPVEYQASGKPLVLALHGRPESSFRLEVDRKMSIMSTVFKRGMDDRYKGFACFWKEFMLPWELIVPKKKLFYVPAPVDLDYYHPVGPTMDFREKSGTPNILIADIWREDVIPLNLLYAATLFQQKYCKTAKLHILALAGKNLKCLVGTIYGMSKSGVLGGVSGLTKHINDFYRAADMVITPHSISTRTVREPLACGTPVVAGAGNKYTPYTASHMDVESYAKAMNQCWQDIRDGKEEVSEFARKTAEIAFDPVNTGKAMKQALEGILK